MENLDILKYIVCDEQKQIWFGKNPLFNTDIADIDNCINYRLPPKFHGKYDVVWLFEKPLNEYHILSWKILLDESIRLLKKNGKIIIRLYNTKDFSVAMVKNFLGRNINTSVQVDYEYSDKNYFNIVFNITRLNFNAYKDKSWTFAILSSGKRDDAVIKFLKSIRENEPSRSQIIISGEQKDIYDQYDVEYLDLSRYRDEKYAEIAAKKNGIVGLTKNANLLIVHDRFYLSKDFFKSFDDYGYDFDFCALKQITEEQKDLPFYCATYDPHFALNHPINCKNFNIMPSTVYVNGGCLLFKTQTISKIKFNDLSFWGQMEDVDIAKTFLNHSLIPRVNLFSEVIGIENASDRFKDNFDFDTIEFNNIIYNPKVQYANRAELYGLKKYASLEELKNYNNSAVFRIKNHLSYKFGDAVLKCYKNPIKFFILPFILLKIHREHAICSKKLQGLPKIETMADYQEAIKYKNHINYKVGSAVMTACRKWYKGGLFWLIVEIELLKEKEKK